jgi:hypothetical protein
MQSVPFVQAMGVLRELHSLLYNFSLLSCSNYGNLSISNVTSGGMHMSAIFFSSNSMVSECAWV